MLHVCVQKFDVIGNFENFWELSPCSVAIFKKIFRHLYGDLNLDEIKKTLRLLSVNGETNLMNLIML